MGKKQDDPRGKQKGAQRHAQGQHGDRTRAHLIEEIQSSGSDERSIEEQRDRERERTSGE